MLSLNLSQQRKTLPLVSVPIRALAVVFLLSASWGAQADTNSTQGTSGWNWSAHIANLNIDSKVAQQQYISDSAFVFGGAAERYTDTSDFTLTLGFDFISYDDKGDFSQNTNKGTKSSDASAMMIFAEFGPKIYFAEDELNYFVAHAGISGIFGSERSIGYCSNCYSEDIDVSGGLYGVLGIGHSFTSSFDLSLQYQQYFSGDLDNSLRLKMTFDF
jgi:hypothetical protein